MTVRARHEQQTMPTFAIGDVHGQFAQFDTLLDHCEARGAELGGARIVLLGDYTDRGPRSRDVVERIIAGPKRPGNVFVPLRGNHDALMLAAYAGRSTSDTAFWMQVGGIETMLSYGVEDEDEMFDDRWRRRIPEAHIAFLRGLLDLYTDPENIFVHAGLHPWLPVDGQNLEDLHWIREGFLDSDHDFGRRVVHGHTIFRTPQIRANRLGIDTGGKHHGRLTAVLLNAGEPEFVQAVQLRPRDAVALEAWKPEPEPAPRP